jgi:hypothetical protein
MNRAARKGLISKIESARGFKLVTLVVSDRVLTIGPTNASLFQLAGDSTRQVLDHLEHLGRREKLGLFLFSRGGDTTVPWVLVNQLRQYCTELEVLIPYRAHSAATMIALGADRIVIGRHGELGPIDPTLTLQESSPGDPTKSKTATIAVEDITAYINLVREGVGITNQAELASSFGRLAETVSPVTLGTISRQQSYIRMVARKLLAVRKSPPDAATLDEIVEGLISRSFFHQHTITRGEAQKDFRLDNVEVPSEDIESLMWQLFLSYEAEMQLRTPINAQMIFKPDSPDTYVVEHVLGAAVESADYFTHLKGELHLTRNRQPIPALTLNMNLQVPTGPERKLTPEAMARLQPFLQEIQAQVQAMVQNEIRKQSPVIGVSGAWSGDWLPVQAD